MKNSTKNTETISLYKPKAVYTANERQYTAAGGEVQVRRVGVVFTSDGRRNEEIDTPIGKANAVVCELYHSFASKRMLSNNAKLSVFRSVFVPILPVVMNLG